MKELAVLKWHKEGAYATAFAAIVPTITTATSAISNQASTSASASESEPPSEPSASTTLDQILEEENGTLRRTKVETQSSAVSTVHQRRDEKARSTHWLAAGAKDGKVSLWDIY